MYKTKPYFNDLNTIFQIMENVDISSYNFMKEIDNNKLFKYSINEKNNFKNGRVIIINTSKDLLLNLNKYQKYSTNKKLYFGKIGKIISKKIKELFGIDLSNYNLCLSIDAFLHVIKKHGDLISEIKRGQIAVDIEDFELIPLIVTKHDAIILSSKELKNNIIFIKEINKLVYYLITVVSKRRHNLEVKTMYKAKKRNSATASDE